MNRSIGGPWIASYNAGGPTDFNDHAPPHFHAEYGEHEALIAIDSLDVSMVMFLGEFALVTEWATLHHGELVMNWDLTRRGEPLAGIEPLE